MGPSSVNEAGTSAKVCCWVDKLELAAVDTGAAWTVVTEILSPVLVALCVVLVALSVAAVLAAMIVAMAIAVTAKEISAVKTAHAKTAMVAAV